MDTLFLITMIEHQSEVDYDMSFRILRYIVLILTDYAAEMEKQQKGITSAKGFRYPPVLPIVFYDGNRNWTAARNFRERTALSDLLKSYIPDFEYIVVPLSHYSNQELIEKQDELSLIMLIDKLRNAADFYQLTEIPEEYFDNLSQNSPESLLKLISKIISAFLYRLNIPKEEIGVFTDQIERRDFTMLFEHFEAYDVQATRRESKAEGRAVGKAEDVLLFLEDLGEIPETVRTRILAEQDLDLLNTWVKAAARADSVDAFISGHLPELEEQ